MHESQFGLADVANNSRLRRGVGFREILVSGIWMDNGRRTRQKIAFFSAVSASRRGD